jgi:hypothetical protein
MNAIALLGLDIKVKNECYRLIICRIIFSVGFWSCQTSSPLTQTILIPDDIAFGFSHRHGLRLFLGQIVPCREIICLISPHTGYQDFGCYLSFIDGCFQENSFLSNIFT